MRRRGIAAVVAALALAACAGDGPPPPPDAPIEAASPAAPVEPSAPAVRDLRTVVVDAGHGGDDAGAIGVSGVQEKDVTLAAAEALARALRRRGYRVVMTRTDDGTTPLPARTERANASGAGLLVSLHANSAPNVAARGVETYAMDLASDESALRLAERENRIEEVLAEAGAAPPLPIERLTDDLRHGATAVWGRALAGEVHTALLARLRATYGSTEIADRRRRSAPFFILLDAEIPGVLVELGYLTDPGEEQRVRSRAFHLEAAEGIADGVDAFVRRAEAAEAGDRGGLGPAGPAVGERADGLAP